MDLCIIVDMPPLTGVVLTCFCVCWCRFDVDGTSDWKCIVGVLIWCVFSFLLVLPTRSQNTHGYHQKYFKKH